MEEMPQTPAAPVAAKPADNDVENHKILAAVGYVSILFLVPMLLAKDSPFAKFHAKQGLVLFLVEVATGILGMILGMLFVVSSRGYGLSANFFTFHSLISLLNLFWLILSIVGIIKALGGTKWELPLLGKLAAKLKI